MDEAADTSCQRDNCGRLDCNGFLCMKALETVYSRAILAERNRVHKQLKGEGAE